MRPVLPQITGVRKPNLCRAESKRSPGDPRTPPMPGISTLTYFGRMLVE